MPLRHLHRLTHGTDIGARLARAGGAALGVHALGAAFALVVEASLARLLGVDDYGTFTLALSWIAVLGLGAQLGFDTAAVRFVADYRAREQLALLRRFLRWCRRFVLASSCTAAIAVGVVAWFLRDHLEPTLVPALLLGALLLPFAAGQAQETAFLQGLQRVVAAKALTQLLRPALLLVGVAGVWLVARPLLSAPSAMAIQLAATALTLVAARASVHRVSGRTDATGVPARPREWLLFAAPLLLISGSQVLLVRADTLMVGHLVGSAEAGIYEAASRLALLVTFGVTAGEAVVAPTIAELHARGDRAGLQRLVALAARGFLACAVPAGAGLVLAGGGLLGAFGPEFSVARPVLAILAGGYVLLSACGPAGFLLIMTGNQRPAVAAIASAAVLNLVLNAMLIPRLGLAGAAWATGLTVGVRSLALAAIAWRRLGLNPTVLSRTGRPGTP